MIITEVGMVYARVTVSLPEQVVTSIDQLARSRSRFVLEAVYSELRRRRQKELRRSLRNPHEESRELADAGIDQWASGLPDEETEDLIDSEAGTAVRWCPGVGWETSGA
jgi:superfamily II RNA helicase